MDTKHYTSSGVTTVTIGSRGHFFVPDSCQHPMW